MVDTVARLTYQLSTAMQSHEEALQSVQLEQRALQDTLQSHKAFLESSRKAGVTLGEAIANYSKVKEFHMEALLAAVTAASNRAAECHQVRGDLERAQAQP